MTQFASFSFFPGAQRDSEAPFNFSMLVVFLPRKKIVCIWGRVWDAYSVQLTDCGSFAGHMTSVVWSEECYPSLIARWYWTGILQCVPKTISSQHLICKQNLDTKISCYARPVLNTCIMCSCWAPSTLEVFDDNSGGWQISRHRWAVLINWIHPWQPKIDVTIVILALTSCTVAAVLQCIQWIINCHARPLKWNGFRGDSYLVDSDLQLLAVAIEHCWWGGRQGGGEIFMTSRWRWWLEPL